jgi:DisA bacterial checkpoint controller nucleotide-binding
MAARKATRLRFFIDCVEHEAADADGGRVFYFKQDEIPREIAALYNKSTDPAVWRPWWSEYLAAKYHALSIFNEHPKTHIATVARRLSFDDSYTEVITRWRDLAPCERLVYQLRADQIGDRTTVKDTWYDDIPGFDEWAVSCAVEPPATDDAETLSARQIQLRRVLSQDCLSTDGADSESGVSLLCTAREAIATFSNASLADLYVVGRGNALPVDGVALEIMAVTLALAAQGEHRLEKFVDSVAAVIKANFSASVVDFLLLRRRERHEQLELLTTTANVDPGVREELEREAAYARPVGITGAVLVARQHHEMLHIGTNDLPSDPRQSPSHRSAYEKQYGRLRNFWVFPIHVGTDLLGALRVVNRLDGDEKTIVPWSFLTRRRLVGLMMLTGRLWHACELELPTDEPGSSSQHVGEWTITAAKKQSKALEALVSKAQLGLVGDSLSAVLQALAALSEIRIEDRRLSATALIVSDDRAITAAELMPVGTFNPLKTLPSLSDLDSFSGGGGNLLVVRTDGQLVGQLCPPADDEPDIGRFSEQFGTELVLRIAAQYDRLVEIWRRGIHMADYAFMVRAGLWALRDFSTGAQDVARHSSFDVDLIENVLRHAVRMSYDHGAIIMILRSTKLPSPLSKGGELVKQPLSDMEAKTFDEHARKDGACLVSSSGILMTRKVTLPTELPSAVHASTRGRFVKTQRRLKESLRGTRHESALCASVHYPDAIVFCASENRTVCAFASGDAVLWDY